MKVNPQKSVRIICEKPLLIFLFCLFLSSCHSPQPTPSLPHEATIVRLLEKADSLMREDSLFYYSEYHYSKSRLCFNDSAILAYQDSAIKLNPLRRKSYLAQYFYLIRSRQFSLLYPLLHRMDMQADTLIDADLRSMKAILADDAGFTDIARKYFLKADSCYDILITRHREDSLLYGVYRLNKTLNLSLMQNDFTPLHRELEVFKASLHDSITGLEMLEHLQSKKAYYDYLFKENHSTPLPKLSLKEHRKLRAAVHQALEKSTHPAAQCVRGVGYRDADGGVEIWIKSDEDRTIADFRKYVFDAPYVYFLRIEEFKITDNTVYPITR